MRGDLPGNERASLVDVSRGCHQWGRNEREELANIREIRPRIHPHQHEVVALREHLLVHLLRTLCRDERVETELTTLRLRANACSVAIAVNRVAGLTRTDVVRLVDDDQDGLPIVASAPEGRQDCLGPRRPFPRASQETPDRREAARVAGNHLFHDGSTVITTQTPARPRRGSRAADRSRASVPPVARSSSSDTPWPASRHVSRRAASSAYSPRSAIGSRRRTAAWTRGSEISEPQTQALGSHAPGVANDNTSALAMPVDHVVGNPVAGSAQTPRSPSSDRTRRSASSSRARICSSMTPSE